MKKAVSSQDVTSDNVHAFLENLQNYAGDNFFEVAARNFELLGEYFNDKYGDTPRICIKGNLLRGHESLVVSVFRKKPVDYVAKYEISSNSGFEHCYRTGRHFLENDIPQAVNVGHYNNPRIDYDRVQEVKELGPIGRHRALCENWSYVWKSGSPELGDHYKSTLVVPMTIWNADLGEEFLQKFGDGEADRLIFGFLCFDHREVDFFDKQDVDVGYFFADLISLYAFNLLNYTSYSETYKSAEEIANVTLGHSVFDFSKKSPHVDLNRTRHLNRHRTAERKSSNNVLLYFQKTTSDDDP